MAKRSDIEIIAIDKKLARIKPVGNLVKASIKPKLNPTSSNGGAGTTTITVPPDDSINAILSTEGTRLQVRYLGRDEMSGMIRSTAPAFTPDGDAVYTIDADDRVLLETNVVVVPQAVTYPSGTHSTGYLHPQALDDDGQAVSTVAHAAGSDAGYGAYVFDAATRTAETAVKELIQRNLLGRLGPAWLAARGGGTIVPFTLLADQLRGGDAYTAGKLPVLRMGPIADGIAPLLQWANLRLRVIQLGSSKTITIETEVPRTFPQTLTYASGVVQGGTPSTNAPSLTRALILGPGEDTARDYSSAADVAREALWGFVSEGTRDASSAPITWPSTLAAAYQVAKYYLLRTEVAASDKALYSAALAQAGVDVLAEGAAKSGLGLTLAETKTFHYGGATAEGRVDLGDTVVVQAYGDPKTAPKFSGQVTSASIELEESGKVTATPVVGERTDDPDSALQLSILELDAAFRRFLNRK